jgi:methionine-rich copper-binding protein CopC
MMSATSTLDPFPTQEEFNKALGSASGVRLHAWAELVSLALIHIHNRLLELTAPRVVRTDPPPDQTDFPVASPIKVTFSEAVDVDSDVFELLDSAGNDIACDPPDFDPATNTATFVPLAHLEESETYTATVKEAEDADGNAMTRPVTWKFTTAAADTTAPAVTARTPADGATGVSPATPGITATFSEAVQAATLDFKLLDPGGALVPSAVTLNPAATTATLAPAAALGSAKTYTVQLRGARDLAGNVMAGTAMWSFTTGSAAGTVTLDPRTKEELAALIDAAIAVLKERLDDQAGDPEAVRKTKKLIAFFGDRKAETNRIADPSSIEFTVLKTTVLDVISRHSIKVN